MQDNLPQVKYDLISLKGGLDQVTPTLSLPPGFARRAANFEASINGGYTRIQGYERFDGHAKPSAATYTILSCTLTGAVAVGNTINGATSSATGKVISISGGTIVITRETGTFMVGETVRIVTTAVGSVLEVIGISADGLTDAQYKNMAADEYRGSISAVPGSGSILGVTYFKNTVYAWRNNAGGTATNIYKSSASGWVLVPLFEMVGFADGISQIFAGDTIVGHTSGTYATAMAVVTQSGSWSAGTAAGYIVFKNRVGTPTTGENIDVGGVKHARSTAAYSVITIPPNGRTELVIGNFGGGVANERIYGANGVSYGFEFDGETYVPLLTGMAIDTPSHVAVHKNHLFFSFEHSLQFSAIGDPHIWSPVFGAGEISMSEVITNIMPLPGNQTSGALGVYTRNNTSILYGSSEATFQLATFNTGTGAFAYTTQNLDQAYALDDRGVVGMATSLNFGNFVTASLTMNLRPFIQARRNLATCSSVNREKGQYRIFFSDGAAIYMTMSNATLLGSMPIQFANPATCCVEGESPDGSATSFFGSTNGFVYLLDAGTSFDGNPIPANLSLVFNSIRSPRILKRYRKASVEMTGDSYAQINFNYDLGYRSAEIEQSLDRSYNNDLRKSYWDNMTWDNFVFDGRDVAPSEIEVEGTAENIALNISSVSDLFQPFTVNSILVHYTFRRGLR